MTGGTVGGAGATDPGLRPLLNGCSAGHVTVRATRTAGIDNLEGETRVQDSPNVKQETQETTRITRNDPLRLWGLPSPCRACVWDNGTGGSSEQDPLLLEDSNGVRNELFLVNI